MLLQSPLISDIIMKRGNKKSKIVDYESDAEIAKVAPVSRVEIIYEDKKAITGAEHEFKWVHIYHMLVEKKVPEVGLEDPALYDNILRSKITKVATTPEDFPCA